MHGIRPKPPTLWPPRLSGDLREWLRARYPDADSNLLGVAAITIDALIRDMLCADRMVKIKARGGTAMPAVGKRASVVESLRRIQDTVASGKLHLYKKAITEAPVDALALIEQVRGKAGWTAHDTVAGSTDYFPIPSPAAIVPHLPAAIAIASRSGAWSKWRRDRTVCEIGIWFSRITGKKAMQSRNRGSFPEFLDGLEAFYSAHLPDEFKLRFGVQKSARAMSSIFSNKRG